MAILWWLLCSLVISALCVRPLSDPDLWWHLVAGRWILKHHSLPGVDHWNAFAAGSPWVAYSWSSELLFAVVEKHFGLPGLAALKTLLLSILLFSLGYCFSELSKSWPKGAALALLCWTGLLPFFGLRPQSISWICCLGVLYASEKIRTSEPSPLKYLLLYGSLLLWANTHITVIFGILIAAAWQFDQSNPKKSLKLVIATLLLGTVVSSMTPNLGKEWLTLFHKSSHPFTNMYIAEFQPLTIFVPTLLLMAILACVLFASLKNIREHRETATSITCIAFCMLGLVIQKFSPYALILLGSLSAICIYSYKLSYEKSDAGESAENPSLGLVWPSLMIVGIIGASIVPKSLGQLFRDPIDRSLVAVDAVNFIQENGLQAPILNAFNEGGYLMYRYTDMNGQSSQKVVLDGRTNVNSPEITQAFLAALSGNHDWRSYLELVKPNTILWENRFPLVSLLDIDPNWCKTMPNGKPEWTKRWTIYTQCKSS